MCTSSFITNLHILTNIKLILLNSYINTGFLYTEILNINTDKH